MQSEISITKSALIVSIFGLIFSRIIFLQGIDLIEKEGWVNSVISLSARVAKSSLTIKPRGLAVPTFLIIPKISVKAVVESVGLTSSGAMGTPRNPMNVGWFNLGTQIGKVGTAVIDGHLDFRTGVGAVFYKLETLVPGDKIYVEDSVGNEFIFVVRELKIFSDKDDTSLVFTSIDGKSHLNLITCAGILDEITKTYSHRLVAFADLETK